MAKFRIAHVATEAAPLAKTGGLADVVGTLPRELERMGHKSVVFLPYYREVRLQGAVTPQVLVKSLPVHIAPGLREEVTILTGVLPGGKVPVYLVDHPKAFDRDQLYGTPEGDYPDNADRFILFSRAVIQAIKELKEDFDVLHCHDWQTALIPAYLRRIYDQDPVFHRTASVFTIHNLAYQGMFPKDTVIRTGFGWEAFTPDQLEFFGKVNFMKAGILYADKVTTVSPTYAKEILTPEHGFGLDGLLRTRGSDLAGVLNGIDQDAWDPAKDKLIAAPFARKTPAGKADCKKALREELGQPSPVRDGGLLIGAVARLADQKGFDLLAQAAPKLAKMPVHVVVLGNGDRAVQDLLEDTARKYPDLLTLRVKFDQALAHRIYAGADAYLMPSKFEPCGLGQMIAQRYGTLPIARATGGLADTIEPVDARKKQGTGFLFKPATPEALAKAVGEAVEAFGDEALWKKLVADAMGADFSWTAPAERYEKVYTQALAKRRK